MSNNAPDYKDNLVFPPQEVKSQDDVKHQDTRSSDVLIKAVEECETLEKKLKIAVKYLKIIRDDYNCSICMSCLSSGYAKTALGKIKELDK